MVVLYVIHYHLHKAVTGTGTLHIYHNNCEAGRYINLNVYEASLKAVRNRLSCFRTQKYEQGLYQKGYIYTQFIS
jgi:hypothetical protein